MQTWGTTDLRRLLGVADSTLRRLVRDGYLQPRRDRRGRYRFGFQDLVVLRALRGLAAARIPPRRINRSLAALRRQLPRTLPLAGLSIAAVGEQVAVREGPAQWDVRSGQYLLAFDLRREGDELRIVDHPGVAQHGRAEAPGGDPLTTCEARFAEALALEDVDVDAALARYAECITGHAGGTGAFVNRGRLLHHAGRLDEAAAVYRAAPFPDAALWFNLGVLEEDRGDPEAALACYERAIAVDPSFVDAHFNAGRLHEVAGRQRESLRHFAAYRRLRDAQD
jgi:tetratricopeptide (TPR) repeat protein